MNHKTRFYICKHCGNLVGMIHDTGVPVICCGEPMQALEPNTVEASQEKHVPVVTIEDNIVTVMIGSAPHPMLDEHWIEWIYLETEHGGQRKGLSPGDAPEAVFSLENDRPVAAYAYCNIHGLWKTEIK